MRSTLTHWAESMTQAKRLRKTKGLSLRTFRLSKLRILCSTVFRICRIGSVLSLEGAGVASVGRWASRVGLFTEADGITGRC